MRGQLGAARSGLARGAPAWGSGQGGHVAMPCTGARAASVRAPDRESECSRADAGYAVTLPGERQREKEGAAVAEAALRPDAPAMPLHDVLRDG